MRKSCDTNYMDETSSNTKSESFRLNFPAYQILMTIILTTMWNFAFARENSSLSLPGEIQAGLSSGQYYLLIRHALAPGTGDPKNFDINDCKSQRNLSLKGRQQALNIGLVLKENGMSQADVYSSQWCRCLETATLLGLDRVKELELLNSFYRKMDTSALQTSKLKDWLISKKAGTNKKTKPIVLVSHQVNITALTQVYPTSGELIVIDIDSSGEVKVVFRLESQ